METDKANQNRASDDNLQLESLQERTQESRSSVSSRSPADEDRVSQNMSGKSDVPPKWQSGEPNGVQQDVQDQEEVDASAQGQNLPKNEDQNVQAAIKNSETGKPVSLITRKTAAAVGPSRKFSSRRSLTAEREEPSPVLLLRQKQSLEKRGSWNPMDVFNTLPSMYTKEKWDELQAQRRCDLSYEHLFWLSRFDPKPNDGHLLETLIDKKVEATQDMLNGKINPIQLQVSKQASKMQLFEQQMIKFRNEVANIGKLRQQMHQVIDDNINLQSILTDCEAKISELTSKVANMQLNFARRLGELDTNLAKLDEFAHRPNNFLEVIKKECDKVDFRLTKKFQDIQVDMQEAELKRRSDFKAFAEWRSKQDKFYLLNVEAIKKVTTAQSQSEKKMTIFERVLSEFQINIEALKTHALSTDLHMESTLPLQIASIAFEVGMGAILKKQFPKFRKNFKKRVKTLEKNYHDCCDPFIVGYKPLYPKNNYELPEEYLNPGLLVQTGSKQKLGAQNSVDNGSDQSPSKSKEKRRRPPQIKSESRGPGDSTINDLQNEVDPRKRRTSRWPSSNCGSDSGLDMEIPKTISRQLLDTLMLWQPVSQRWTIRDLYVAVTKSVTDFLKIPMYEMTSDEFYSLYNDADRVEMGLFKPLPKSAEQEASQPVENEGADSLATAAGQKHSETFQSFLPTPAEPLIKSALKQPKREVSNDIIHETKESQLSDSSLDSKEELTVSGGGSPHVKILETPIIQAFSPQLSKPALAPVPFKRMHTVSGLQDPRAAAQEAKMKKAQELQQQQERRKLQEQVTQAVESVVMKVDIIEQKYQLRFDKIEAVTKAQEKEIQRLEAELKAEKALNEGREQEKAKELKKVNENIELARKRIKVLVGELEESMVEQLKIPSLQILHTEYQRLQDIEQKNIGLLLKRKQDIKAYQQANGGRVPKDDGLGIEIRKDLTATRTKLRIVKKKIKRYGQLGKIPMGASMRVYHKDEDSVSSEETSSEEQFEDTGSSAGSSDGREKKKQKKVKKQDLLETGLVYQPKFNMVVKETSVNLNQFVSKENISRQSWEKEEEVMSKNLRHMRTPTASQFKRSSEPEPVESVGSLGEDSKSLSDSAKSIRILSCSDDSSITNLNKFALQSQRPKQSRSNLKFQIQEAAENDEQDKTPTRKHNDTQIVPKSNLAFLLLPTQGEDSKRVSSAKSPGTRERKPPSRGVGPENKFRSSESLLRVVQHFISPGGNESKPSPMEAGKKTESNSLEEGPFRAINEGMEETAKKELKRKEKRQVREQQQMSAAINYGSKKMSNVIKKNFIKEKRRERLQDAEVQTDPVDFGDIQMDLSDNEKQHYNLQNLKVDAATEAPRFLILNVVPGKPETDFFVKYDKPAPSLRIKTIVEELKAENERKGVTNTRSDLAQVKENFALIKGSGPSDSVLAIARQNQTNEEAYFVYQKNQEQAFFKQALELQQQKLQETLRISSHFSGPQNIVSSPRGGVERMRTVKKKDLSSRKSALDTKSHLTKQSRHSKSRSRRGGMAKNREEPDVVSQATRKSKIKRKSRMTSHEEKSFRSKRTNRKKSVQQSEQSKEGVNRRASKEVSGISQLNEKIEKSQRFQKSEQGSLMNDSSFGVSSDEGESEEDDFVTFKEFADFRDWINAEYNNLKRAYYESTQENLKMLQRLDNVDWTVIRQVESKLADILGDFQLTVDGLLLTIEADIKRQKTQVSDLESKYELLSTNQNQLIETSQILRDEFFAYNDDNWALQQQMVRFTEMQVGLAMADEVDKANISLVGQREVHDQLKTPKLDANQILNLDPNCRQCQCLSNPERTSLLQNLKLACLMYQPSQVQVPLLSKYPLGRAEVINQQKLVADELSSLTLQRRARIEVLRQKLLQLEQETQEIKVLSNTHLGSPSRYLQFSDQKTLQDLNYFGVESANRFGFKSQRPTQIDLQVTLKSKNRVISPLALSPKSAKQLDSSEPQTVCLDREEMQAQSQMNTVMRKPIIKGKIDSRALLGLKKNLNTASNFSQILQQQQTARQQSARQQSSSAHRVSHQSAANLGLHLPTDIKPGDARYKMTSSLEPELALGHVASDRTSANMAQHSVLQIAHTIASPPNVARLNPLQRRSQIQPSNSGHSKSPPRMQKNAPGHISLDVASSNGSLPRTVRDKPIRHSRNDHTGKISDIQFPQINKQSQVIEPSWPNVSDGVLQSFNMQTISDAGLSRTKTKGAKWIEDKQAKEDSDMCEQEKVPEVKTQKMKVEVRKSMIFSPVCNEKQVTDEEIRAARRNVVTGKFAKKPAKNSNDQ